MIERSEYVPLIEANKIRTIENKKIYRRRQAIVKHPHDIIERQWGFYYIMTKKTIKHASADIGLIFTAFNLRRIFNLIDKNMLQKYLMALACFYYIFIRYFKHFLACLLYFSSQTSTTHTLLFQA